MRINHLNLEKYQYYQRKYHVSSLCAKVLAALSLDDSRIEEILENNTSLAQIDDSLVSNLVKRIFQAKQNNEKVLICGDYDCDGICATTILYDALKKCNINVGYYIPNRFSQGYGLHPDTVDMAHDKGYSLLVTVDNGVKATEALKKAKLYNMDIILTDHHTYEEDDLIFDYFLHPAILPSFYQGLCGAGVAFLIAKALVGLQKEHVILAGIATIADVVPLFALNRILVKECIYLLNQKEYDFIQMLANDSNVWDEKKIAFQIVPKINSIGRMADIANANNVVKFLLHKDKQQIVEMVDQINKINEIRKKMSAAMEKKAESLIDPTKNFQILYDASFHEGLNGIVANRFVHKLQKPVMVLSENDSILKGSIRSNGIDLTDFFDDIKDMLLSYGGHKEAAGISFSKNKLVNIQNFSYNKVKDLTIENTIDVIDVTIDDITIDALLSLHLLKPFGKGIEMPLFYIKDTPNSIQVIGNGAHLKYIGNSITYLYFNQKERYDNDINKTALNFIGTLEINTFRNKQSINMIVSHIDEED